MNSKFNPMYAVSLSLMLTGLLVAPMTAMAQNAAGGESSTPVKAEKKHDWGGKHKKGMHQGGHHNAMKDLNLSEAQKQQFKAAHEKFRQENAGTMATMKAKREQFKALGDDPANAAKKEQLKAEMKRDREALMAKKKASMQGILNPEQQAKWDAKKAERKAQWQAKHAQHKANQKPGPKQ
ncbi:Spy/CpxP family protein refolding chaperone [Vampirovibrio sp.]|uniref:Spy/CpxP family protein refolding chaperone n=1 Tax=Vampirovibrio sp. TaxID=2717857 RepID=UPI003593AFE6